jgi:hypothetical protein
VREIEPGRYEIIAGERRFRAAKIAELAEVPVIVKELDDRQARFAMLAENVQRADLTPQDEQRFYQELENSYNLSLREIADLVHKSSTYVRNRLVGNLQTFDSIKINGENFNKVSSEDKLLNPSQSETDKTDGATSAPAPAGLKAAGKSSFKFSVSTIQRLAGNLATARQTFKQPEYKPAPGTARQIRESLDALEKEIAELKKTLSEVEVEGDGQEKARE